MVVGLIGEQLLSGNCRVTAKPALPQAVGGKAVCDTRVEPNTCDVEEKPAVQLSRIDSAFAPVERDIDCVPRIERNAQFPREPVARPAWNHAERRVAERQGRADFIDGAVAAPSQHQGCTLRECGLGELVRVSGTLSDENLAVDAVARHRGCRELGTIARHVQPPTCTGYRIDDDRCTLRCHGGGP